MFIRHRAMIVHIRDVFRFRVDFHLLVQLDNGFCSVLDVRMPAEGTGGHGGAKNHLDIVCFGQFDH